MKTFDRNIGFRAKRNFFRRKLAKIAENSDHNIDPWKLTAIISRTRKNGGKFRGVRFSRQKSV
jgi:hypothetical protein